MKKSYICFLSLVLLFVQATLLFAAEVKNVKATYENNRVRFAYDLEGGDKESEVTVRVGEYRPADLHFEGDVGKVKPGPGKEIWWNILQDFPRGLNVEVDWEIAVSVPSFTDLATGMEMVFVKGGCFDMGDIFGDGFDYEKPVHNVCVDDFYIGKYEVMQSQWLAVMGNNPSNNISRFSKTDNYPVEMVNWLDIQAYIQKLNAIAPRGYRLPTEAEWEYAARSGGKREKYAGTSNDADLGNYAWYSSNAGGITRSLKRGVYTFLCEGTSRNGEIGNDTCFITDVVCKTHPTGQKQPNGLGLYDMSGNVWEWCQDRYGEKYYNQSPRKNPPGPPLSKANTVRIQRGGSCVDGPGYVRTVFRSAFEMAVRLTNVGFRLSASVPTVWGRLQVNVVPAPR